jgi:hypothetical protein
MGLKLYEEQKHSIYEIQNEIGVAKDTLYRYARGTRDVVKMPIPMLLGIAYYEKIEPNKLYEAMIEYKKKLRG